MEKPALSDPKVFPTQKVLSSHLGKAKQPFDALFDYNHAQFPEFVERWKYYNDGKSWLMNVSKKKKTVFWLSVHDGWFRTAFYVGTKAAQTVMNSKIPKSLKNTYMESEGKTFRAIPLVIKAKKDVDIYKELLSVKLSTM